MKFFISSTYEDLVEIRDVAINIFNGIVGSAKNSTGEVVAMEFFCATERTCKEECLKELDKSDIVIGIYGNRYGSIDAESGLSMTEIEFEYAISKQKPILAFVLQTSCREEKEENFIKEKVFKRGKSCAKFKNKKDFADRLNKTLQEYFCTLEGYSFESLWLEVSDLQQEIAVGIKEEKPEFELQMNAYTYGQELFALNNILSSVEYMKGYIDSFNKENSAVYSYAYTYQHRPEDLSEIDKIELIDGVKKNSEAILLNWELINLGLNNHSTSILLSVMFLKLCHMQNRLLTEVWTEELRKEVIDTKNLYLETIKKSHYMS